MDSAQPVSGTLKNNLKKKALQHTARLSNKHISDEGIFFFYREKLTRKDKQIQGERKTGSYPGQQVGPQVPN